MKKFLHCLFLLSFFLFSSSFFLFSQTVYEHISSTGIYAFLDEMANEKFILLNTAVKPYSRALIAEKLSELNEKKEQLNKRQQADLKFYQREFFLELKNDSIVPFKPFHREKEHTISLIPPLYSFGNKEFNLNFRPYGGGQGYINKNQTLYNSYWGGSVFMYGWKNLGIYANYRDAHQSKQVLALPTYLTQTMGANYKLNEGQRPGGDYSEMRGGITATINWFSLELLKEHIVWGNNHNGSNLFSGRTPSFPMIKMRAKPTKWFELNYFHGWLVSEEIDSSRSYNPGTGLVRKIYLNKFIAANFITIGPVKGAALSFGNSIIYSDMNVHPAYLIPFLYYKPVDHTINNGIDNQNSQIFFDLSIRSLKHLHIFATLLIDEFSITRIRDKNRYNFYSYKAGFMVNNFPVKNIFYGFEYTFTSALTYKHRVPSLTFESNRFNIGHYLGDNARNFFTTLGYKPIRTLSVSAAFSYAEKGTEHPYIEGPGTKPVDTYQPLDTIIWQNQQVSFTINYEFAYNCKVEFTYINSNITSNGTSNHSPEYYLERYTPAFMRGRNNTFMLGLHFGF